LDYDILTVDGLFEGRNEGEIADIQQRICLWNN
jgi:hypothetical protein